MNNGDHTVGLSQVIEVTDDTPVVIKYSILNIGHNPQLRQMALAVFDEIDKIAAAKSAEAVGLPGDVVGPILQELNLNQKLNRYLLNAVLGFLDPDCDGWVASDVIITTGRQLRQLTASGQYVGFGQHNGSNSPAGCGSNSSYQVWWSVRPQ